MQALHILLIFSIPVLLFMTCKFLISRPPSKLCRPLDKIK